MYELSPINKSDPNWYRYEIEKFYSKRFRKYNNNFKFTKYFV